MKLPAWLTLSIFKKILIAMLFVAVVPLCVIWYVNYQNTIEQTTEAINKQLADSSDKLTGVVDDWLTMHHKILNQNGALADTVSMDAERQNPILRSVLDEYAWSYLVFTIGTDGMNIGRSDTKKPKNYVDRTYFKQVMDGAPLGQQVLISRTTGKPALVLSAPVYGASEFVIGRGPIAGVIAIGLHLTEISERITNLQLGRTGFAFLLNETGKVVAHQKEELANKLVDFSKHPAFIGRPSQGTKRIIYDDGGRAVIAVVQTTRNGWAVVTQQDYAEAFAPVRKANRNALILLATTLVIVTLIAYSFAQRIAQPIRTLTSVANEMSRGKLVVRIDEVNRRDEIGALAAAIDRMGRSVKLAIERLSTKTTTGQAERANT